MTPARQRAKNCALVREQPFSGVIQVVKSQVPCLTQYCEVCVGVDIMAAYASAQTSQALLTASTASPARRGAVPASKAAFLAPSVRYITSSPALHSVSRADMSRASAAAGVR